MLVGDRRNPEEPKTCFYSEGCRLVAQLLENVHEVSSWSQQC